MPVQNKKNTDYLIDMNPAQEYSVYQLPIDLNKTHREAFRDAMQITWQLKRILIMCSSLEAVIVLL